MVIQRWQSLWLLIAAALMTAFCFLPMAVTTSDMTEPAGLTLLMPCNVPAVMCVGLLAAVIMLVAIFLFRNIGLQKRTVLLGILMAFLEVVLVTILLFIADSKFGVPDWNWSLCLPVISMFFGMAAYRGIRHDEKLLKAADRLR